MGNKYPIQFILNLKDQATENLKGIQKQFAQLEKDASGFNRRMQKLGGQLQKTGKKLSIALTAPIAGLAAFGVKDVAEFEGALADVRNLLSKDLVGPELQNTIDGISKSIKSLTTETGADKIQLAKSFQDLTDAGFSVSDSMKILRESTKLAVVEGTELNETTQSMIQIMTKFNVPATEAGNLAAKLRMLSEEADNIPTTELLSAIQRIAPTAKSLGLSMDEVFGLIAQGSKKLAPDQLFGALEQGLETLLKGSPKAGKEAMRLGVDFGRTSVRGKGLVSVMEAISKSNRLAATSFTRLFKSPEAAQLFEDISKNADTYRKTIQKVGNDTENVANINDDFRARSQALDRQLMILNSNFKELRDTAIAPLVGFLNENMPAITAALQRFATALKDNKGLQQLVFWGGAVLAVLGPLLIVLGLLVKGIGAAWTAIVFLGGVLLKIPALLGAIYKGFLLIVTAIKAFVAIIGGATLAAIGLWLAALAGVASIAYQIYKNWGLLTDFFKNELSAALESPLHVLQRIADFLMKFPLEILNRIVTLGGLLKTPEFLRNMLDSDVFGANNNASAQPAAATIAPLPERQVSQPQPPRTNIKEGQVGVNVNFSNMPKGTRVETDDKMGYLNSLNLGYALGGSN